MRLVAVAFWSSNVLLLAAGGAFVWTRVQAAPARPAAPAECPLRVVRFRPEALSAARPVPAAKNANGLVEFELGDGEKLVGIAGARAFPVEDDVPALNRGFDLSSAQFGGRIDGRELMKRDGLPAEVFLDFNLLVRDGGGREEYRRGWSRFEVMTLRTSGVTIEASARQRTTIDVRTKEGQPVPGALVAVDPVDMLQVGLVSQFATTSDDGGVVLSGLVAGTNYRAVLVDGVGPDPRRVTAIVTGDGSRHELRSAISGRWEFVRHRLHFMLPGSSTRVTELTPTDPACAGAWPVDRWVPPGRGLDAPFWIMLPASESPRAVPAHVVFNDRDGVDVPDLRVPSRLAFSPTKRDVRIVTESPGASASASASTREAPVSR